MAEYIRIRPRRRLQTAIHRYVNRDTGRRVILIGACHVGTPEYFAGLRKVIADAEDAGAVVQCEGSHLVPVTATDVTDQERDLMTDFARIGELEKRRVIELGWVGQISGLEYPSRWQPIDLSTLDLIRMLGLERSRDMVRKMSRMFDWPDSDTKGLLRLRTVVTIGIRWGFRDRAAVKPNRRDPTYPVLHVAREELALDGVRGTTADTVLIWGAAHMHNLGTGLAEQGFVREGTTDWHTALQLPSILGCLWRLHSSGSRPTIEVGIEQGAEGR